MPLLVPIPLDSKHNSPAHLIASLSNRKSEFLVLTDKIAKSAMSQLLAFFCRWRKVYGRRQVSGVSSLQKMEQKF